MFSAKTQTDNDGTLRPRPSIDKLQAHVLYLSQATWTSSWAMRMASIYAENTGTARRRYSCGGTGSAATFDRYRTLLDGVCDGAFAPSPRSQLSTRTARSGRVRRSTNRLHVLHLAREDP